MFQVAENTMSFRDKIKKKRKELPASSKIFTLFFILFALLPANLSCLQVGYVGKPEVKTGNYYPVMAEKSSTIPSSPLVTERVIAAITTPAAGLIQADITDIKEGPSSDSEIVSQAVMGEEAKILEEKKGWLRIELIDQYNYAGWVKREAVRVGKSYPSAAIKGIVIQPEAFVYEEPNTESQVVTEILLGSTVEVKTEKEDFSMVLLPDDRDGWIRKGDITTSKEKPSEEDLLETAEKLRDVEYLWGGMSSRGIDCSGFMHMIYRAHGIKIHRDAHLQFRYDGVEVKPEDLKEGDLIFFEDKGKVYHVGMYIGCWSFIHASSASGKVTVSYLDSPYYAPYYGGAKRIIEK